MNEYTICVNCGSGIRNITQDICPFCGLSVTKRSNIILRLINNNKPNTRNTCEHCKLWITNKTDWFGECLHNNMNEENNYISSPDASVLEFREDFGCIFWESKE